MKIKKRLLSLMVLLSFIIVALLPKYTISSEVTHHKGRINKELE